jgi:hypothetical protein
VELKRTNSFLQHKRATKKQKYKVSWKAPAFPNQSQPLCNRGKVQDLCTMADQGGAITEEVTGTNRVRQKTESLAKWKNIVSI